MASQQTGNLLTTDQLLLPKFAATHKQLRQFYTAQRNGMNDRTVWPQMGRDQFRNVSNLDLVEMNRFRFSLYAYIKPPIADFLTPKMLHMRNYQLTI